MALCQSREDWLARQEKSFLLVTGREIRLEDEPLNPRISGLCLPMGTKLTLLREEEIPETVNRRGTYGCYVVQIATRDGEGYLQEEYALIPMSADVSVGYLPYTSNRLLEQAFKCLGSRYGWAGNYHGYDCSGYIQAVYSCFGFELPRGSGAQIALEGTESGSFRGMDGDGRSELLGALPAGTLLYFKRHIMLYLGEVEGEPYVISAVGSVCFRKDGEFQVTDPVKINSVAVNSLRDTFRATNYSWLDSLSNYNSIGG